MLVGCFRQSETSANQRVKALELMAEVPGIGRALMDGDLNLSTLAMTQRQILREEKITGAKITAEKKAEIVELVRSKTLAQAEVALMTALPESSKTLATKERRISKDEIRLSISLPDRVREKMEKFKNFVAAANPHMDQVEVIERALDIALAKVDPTQKKIKQRTTETATPAGIRPTYYSVETDKVLWDRAGSQCEYIDEITKRRCESKFALERDHIVPLALGGSNEMSNLRLCCRAHNLFYARKHFGG